MGEERYVLRFKSFSGEGQQLEAAVNAWLDSYEPDVKEMLQTTGSNGSLTVSFLYEEGFRGQELRFDEEHGMVRAAEPVASLEEIPGKPLHVAEEPGHIVAENQEPRG